MEMAAGVAKAPGHIETQTMDTFPSSPTSHDTPIATQSNSRNPFSAAWRFILGTTVWGPNTEGSDESYLTVRRRERQQEKERNASNASTIQGNSGNASEEEDEEKQKTLAHVNTAETTATTDTAMTSFENSNFAALYDEDGRLVLQPAPTQDPRDPLNLSITRKVVALFFLCFYGALAASAELILGSLLPVFALQYAGLDPKLLLPLTKNGLPAGSNSLEDLQNLPNAPPIWHIYLLASLPVLMIGVANLFLIPLAIAVGRRGIVLTCGILAIGGAVWAGFSQSLGSHLGARCVQALGAGTVESLIPFIIQDMVHVHQRNTYISAVFAAQGIIIISLGIASPYLIIKLSWRWVYFITAAGAALFLAGVFCFLPETRWDRTSAEMNGIPRKETRTRFKPRTWKSDLAMFPGKKEWRKGYYALLNTLRTFFYPQIFFITMLNSAMIACAFASAYVVSPALLTRPWKWPFYHLGLCLIPVLIAAICVGLVTGALADWTANWAAKKRGRRVPENQLLNLALPTICGLVGSLIFGLAGEYQDRYSWGVFLFGLGLMAFGFLGANTVGAVYVLESYPHLAGPALVNIASFRCIIAFILSFKVSEWIVDFGYLKSMVIYTALMAFFALLTPIVYVYGPSWRERWPATKYRTE